MLLVRDLASCIRRPQTVRGPFVQSRYATSDAGSQLERCPDRISSCGPRLSKPFVAAVGGLASRCCRFEQVESISRCAAGARLSARIR